MPSPAATVWQCGSVQSGCLQFREGHAPDHRGFAGEFIEDFERTVGTSIAGTVSG